MVRKRRHHNNDGRGQISTRSHLEQVRQIAGQLDVPFLNDLTLKEREEVEWTDK